MFSLKNLARKELIFNFVHAFGICSCLNSDKFVKLRVKITDKLWYKLEIQTNSQNVIKKIVHMSRWNITENITAEIGN